MKPLILIIMDGFGVNPSEKGNAITAAKTPNLDRIFASYPYTTIGASGMDVGLPDGQMGNSEVGHTNIGAGRVVYQELTRITKSIRDGDFFENEELVGAIENCKKNGSDLHLLGLMSDGGVHSHNTHLWGLLELCKKMDFDRVYVHCFLDGRDTPPESGADFVAECVAKTKEIGAGKVATVMGRYYAMDRELKWDRVAQAYAAMVYGEGAKNPDPVDAIRASYAEGVTDEFVKPVVCTDVQIKANDSVIFYNFRPDRAREITRTLVDPDFDGFERKSFFPLYYVCMTQYDASMPNVHIAYKPESLDMPFGEVIANRGMKQLRIAEYTKYAHVTYFFNGGNETVFEGEDRIMIDSPNVPTYDLQPEMSAYTVTDTVIEKLESGVYGAIILNFANCDMVGHTGVFDAAVKAVEAVDECVGRVVDCVLKLGGMAVITADHGNSEQMLDSDGVTPFTAHTTNLVPFCIVGAGDVKLREGGRLADIIPTMLQLLNIEQPKQMTGESIIVG